MDEKAKEEKELSFLLNGESSPQGEKAGLTRVGRVSSQLTGIIAYERSPSLFDTEEIRKRDEKLAKFTQELKESDLQNNLRRNDKPVKLTPLQTKIVIALNLAVSQYMEDEDIKQVIEKPSSKIEIKRRLPTGDFCKLIFGSSKKQRRAELRRELRKISNTLQVLPLKWTDLSGRERKAVYISPLITIPEEVVELTEEVGEESLDYITIQFSRVFFLDLNRRYFFVTEKVFEVWRGSKGELWTTLFTSISSVYWQYHTAANKAEERVREEQLSLSRAKRLTPDKLQEKIEEARADAMKYELLFSTIKKKLSIDYESTGYYRHKFKGDLDNAIRDFKAMEIIRDGLVVDGRTEKKVIFILRETQKHLERAEQKLLLSFEQK